MKQKIDRNSIVAPEIISFFCYLTAIFYSSSFVYLMFFARRRKEVTDRYLTVIPLKSTIGNFLKINSNQHHELFNYYTNLIGNIVLFIPLPIFLVCLAGVKNLKRLLLFSFILSFSVELLQFLFKKGVADIDDILLNLLGTTIGFFIYRIFWPQAIEIYKR